MARVLLVEDDESNRDMLSQRLARRSYEVLLAHDGAEGVARAPSAGLDLVLMDMSLPVLDRWEATRQLTAPHTALAAIRRGMSNVCVGEPAFDVKVLAARRAAAA